MYIGLIAKRYASALLEFASLQGQADLVYDQARELIKYFQTNPKIKAEIASPVISSKIKSGIILGGVKGVCSAFERFIAMVINHKREEHLLFMLSSFTQLYEKENGIANVTLTVAAPVGEEIVGGVGEIVRKNIGCKSVQMESRVDERLIGGFTLRIADRQMDASVTRELADLKRILMGKL